jgi:lipopolysaccharide export system ATP-binding protein
MKHRLPKPKSSRIRAESPADEIGRQTDGGAAPPAARRSTPPPLPYVNKTSASSSSNDSAPDSFLLPDSAQLSAASNATPSSTPPSSHTDSEDSFSFLGGAESPAKPEAKEKPASEPKGADEIASILRASKTTLVEQKMVEVETPATAKKKTRRVEPPALPIEEKPKTATPTATAEKVDPNSVLIQTRGLVKQYGGRRVVNGVDIYVRPGEVVGLLGKNGAGKTTTFYMIVGLVTPTEGHVYMGNEDVTRMPMYRRARRGIGYLPQEESIFRKLTVEENLLAILETLPLTEEERDARCDELLKDFGLEHVRENVAITLSGGEKRRVTIARALVTNPMLLLLDEPFSGVDPMAVHDIQEIILNLKNRGMGVLITDHNVRETLSVVDRAYIIDEGRVLSTGSREFLLNDPIAREIYLGHRFSM